MTDNHLSTNQNRHLHGKQSRPWSYTPFLPCKIFHGFGRVPSEAKPRCQCGHPLETALANPCWKPELSCKQAVQLRVKLKLQCFPSCGRESWSVLSSPELHKAPQQRRAELCPPTSRAAPIPSHTKGGGLRSGALHCGWKRSNNNNNNKEKLPK